MKLTMSVLQKVVNEEVTKTLSEYAKTLKDARAEKLALLVSKEKDIFILYDAAYLTRRFVQQGGLRKADVLESIKAMMSILDQNHGKAYGTKSVSGSAAEDKYGPMLYDIVLSHVKGLTPDRESVTQDANNVWWFYDRHRTDVKKLPLDDIENPKTKTKEDDSLYHDDPLHASNPLNKAYFMTKPKSYKTLEDNHMKFMKKTAEEYKRNEVENFLFNAADRFFMTKYWSSI